MRFHVRPMRQVDAEAVAGWRYPGEYAFYDAVADPDDMAELLDPARRGERLYAADGEDGRLAGFLELKPRDAGVELGLGLRPDLCGRGIGPSFTRAAIDLIRSVHGDVRITLAVAAFNRRAIIVYERTGFTETGRHARRLGGREWEFVDMELAVRGPPEPGT